MSTTFVSQDVWPQLTKAVRGSRQPCAVAVAYFGAGASTGQCPAYPHAAAGKPFGFLCLPGAASPAAAAGQNAGTGLGPGRLEAIAPGWRDRRCVLCAGFVEHLGRVEL